MQIKIFSFIYFLINIQFLFAQTEWKSFTPPGQHFEVTVPGEMKNGEKKLLTDVGEMHPVTWIYEGKGDDKNHLYLLSYVDYPSGTFHQDSTALIQELLQVSMETHVSDLNGALAYTSDAPYGQYLGIIYRASYNDNKLVVKSRMVLIGDRFYAIQVYTTSDKSLNADMNRYLESFRAKP
jgi:hypothetical protein